MLGSTISLNDLIRAGEHRHWHRQTKGLGGLEVDDQLELRWLLDGEVRGLGALEDLVDVRGGATKVVSDVHPVGHQAPELHRLPKGEHAREPRPGREIHDESSTAKCRWTRRHKKRLDPG